MKKNHPLTNRFCFYCWRFRRWLDGTIQRRRCEARFYQQLERGGGAILFMFTLSLLNLRWQQAFALSFFLVVLLALFAVLGFGVKINNARRWLNIGFYVQPSEFMKVALPLGLAFLYARLSELRLWHHLAFLAATAFVGILVLLQPDLGTAVVVFMVGVATVFFAGIGWRWIAVFPCWVWRHYRCFGFFS